MTIMKEHVSYSEIRQWKECTWRHKLLYIDKISTYEESPHLHYGTIIHDACEHYLKTKELKIKEAQNIMRSIGSIFFYCMFFGNKCTQIII